MRGSRPPWSHRRADDQLRRRCAARPGRRRRLRRRRQARSRRLRPGHPRRPQAAPLPQSLQARRGAALQLLHALPPLPFRGADHGRTRRAVRRRGSCTPAGRPTVEVITTAKRDLAAGHVLDGLGGYDTYGDAERADVTAAQDLLPMGVAEGCLLRRDVARDDALTYADVDLPQGRLVDRLREEQAKITEPFAVSPWVQVPSSSQP